jgi:carbonic anhydrase
MKEVIAKNDPNVPGGPWKDGPRSSWAESMTFLPFPGADSERERVEKSVVLDVQYLQSHPLIKPTVKLTGYVYDLHTGKVEEVDCK